MGTESISQLNPRWEDSRQNDSCEKGEKNNNMLSARSTQTLPLVLLEPATFGPRCFHEAIQEPASGDV